MSNIIECRSVSFSYNEGNNQTSVLKNLNFEIKSGETTAIIGQSGCGKSTLLNLMAGLDTPTDGDVLIANTNISKISEKDSKRKDKKLELMEKRLDSHKEVEKKPAEVFDANDDVNSISATKAVFGDQNGAIAG